MRRGWLLLLMSLLLAGCGSSSRQTSTAGDDRALDQSAARFAVRIQAELKQGKFAQAWRTLHPAEKRVVSAEQLASCYPKNQYPGKATFRTTKTRDVHWLVPGTASTVEAKEVTVTATSSAPKQTFAQHLVRTNGGWVWMLNKQYFDAARRGAC